MKLVLTLIFALSYGIVMSQGSATLSAADCDKLILKFDQPLGQELTILLEKEVQDQIYKVIRKFRQEDLSDPNISIHVTGEGKYRATYIFDQLIPKENKSIWVNQVNRSNALDHSCSNPRSAKTGKRPSEFGLYPNPANTSVNLIFDNQPENWEYLIYDAVGRLIISGSNEETIDVSALQGIYFMQVLFNDQKFIKKFTVISK